MSMLTLTSKTRFGAMRGCQEQICEARGPKRIIFASGVGCGVTFGLRARLTGFPMIPMGSSGSLRGVNCNIPHRRVRT
jgi:hypothetical protein